MALLPRQIGGAVLVTALVVALSCLDLSFGHESHAHHHHCDHGHHHHHHHHEEERLASKLLPEELAEEEDMRLYGFGFEHDRILDRFAFSDLSGLGLWVNALGCSLLVSMASLICLIILPLIFVQGKPSKVVVDSLALFGAGAMLGDAFLHQLPHAFGGEHSHSHDHHAEHDHHDHFGHEPSHSHSLKDLSVGISILAGIVVFLLVEKLVRYVEGNSGGAHAWGHGHHHHHHKGSKKLKDDSDSTDIKQSQSSDGKDGKTLEMSSEGKVSDEVSNDSLNGDDLRHESLRKRTAAGARKDEADVDTANGSADDTHSMEKDDIHSKEKEPAQSPSNLVFGYLNLFSDGVHNFTDGMALGSAFLLYGSVGGWSRTLFLLAHELPQEVGDFGILVRSGFSVSKALFFNFLSALVALVGTAMALLWGQDPGQSSYIEGFTAGGFIYIAVAGVLAEMNSNSNTTLKSTAIHITSLILGMAVALCISLVE
ncbi:IAA-alanine resistance protein 1 isoform X1 [Quercus robur]|uniref:IAA-alanine resistance protein 1 isoform X1 n=1 Tax=Quercus robur TaxID=38942 RepID=UPI002161B0D5|nr:IAA-alanine resistance protein 1 isoform X1 [Quercus robur]